MEQLTIDRGTKIFYWSLIGLVVLDLFLILWILNSFASFGTSAYASQVPAVSDATKPSPFEIADAKLRPVQAARRKVKPVSTVPDAAPRN